MTTTAAMAESLYQKGALPAPLKREFVDKLLDDGACICGTPLAEHTDLMGSRQGMAPARRTWHASRPRGSSSAARSLPWRRLGATCATHSAWS